MDRHRLRLMGRESPAESCRPKAAGRSLVVLVSGRGSNLQAIIDACDDGSIDAEIAAVISNVDGAFALERAQRAGIETLLLTRRDGEDRASYDRRLAAAVAPFTPDFVVLAGWMRILTVNFLDHYRVVNLHPALPGEYPGVRAIERAFDDARTTGRDHTGVMIHFVPDEGVDDGPVIATATVPIRDDDDLAALTERVHHAEHRLLVGALRELCRSPGDESPIATLPGDPLDRQRSSDQRSSDRTRQRSMR